MNNAWTAVGGTALLAFGLFAGLALGAPGDDAVPDAPAAGIDPDRPECWPVANDAGMDEVVRALEDRAQELQRKEASLLAREEDLRTAETDLMERLATLNELREEIGEIIRETDDVEEDKIRRLTKMVEAMKPKEGAAYMAELDTDLAVKVLDRMNPRKSAKVIGKMDPDTAARLSLKVATVRPGGLQ